MRHRRRQQQHRLLGLIAFHNRRCRGDGEGIGKASYSAHGCRQGTEQAVGGGDQRRPDDDCARVRTDHYRGRGPATAVW
ncbi:MAG: hypothetical protein JWR32_2244 [Mycobacterium sp.]|nr:hypothetical protein [Mycobacterium sp.]